MAGSRNGEGEIIAGINVTPLVDVTLVLLIIFIVTAKIVVTPAVPLELPEASRTEETQVIFSVVVPATGGTLINGAPAGDDGQFIREAQEASRKDQEVRAVINADGAVPHRKVIHILDLLKRGGISRVAFGAIAADEEVR
ncbi:MAG TPA: biopolymer transporter ExbD [Polyangia bacterium]|jgi:biopolymer transport protein ExbD|nr:biopolymer transporter ExbD [Polyangia bacterium]